MKIKTAKRWLRQNVWNIAKAKNGLMKTVELDKAILRKEKHCLKILKKGE